MPRVIPAFTQFFDDAGSPLNGGWLKFIVSGTVSTLKDTYSDLAETTPNTNPLQLDSSGRCPNVFGSGAYKVISYEDDDGSPGVQMESFDPVGEGSSTGQFEVWINESIYSEGQIVAIDDYSAYYRSLEDDNQGNDPESDATKWELILLTQVWNTNETYSTDELVTHGDYTFRSLQDSNVGQNPNTAYTYWEAVSLRTYDAAHYYQQGEIIKDTTGYLYRSITVPNVGHEPSANDGTYWLPVVPIVGSTTYTSDQELLEYQMRRNNIFHNQGATGEVILTLPNANSGLEGGFWVSTAEYLRVKAQSGDYLFCNGKLGASGGFVRSNVANTYFYVKGLNTTLWFITELNGTLLMDTDQAIYGQDDYLKSRFLL